MNRTLSPGVSALIIRLPIFPLILPLPFLASCDSSGSGRGPGEALVAEAAGHEFTIDEAATLLALRTQPSNQEAAVEAVANLWVDYLLLALFIDRDSTLGGLDFEGAIGQEVDQELIYLLRDSVIRIDTVFSEEDLREYYEETLPGASIRVRHILLGLPPNATPAQLDSVVRLAGDLRGRAMGGEGFEALAEEYSQDLGSASSGGDLGTFTSGEMLPELDRAAFALEPGEVSDPVRSRYGIHLLLVDERNVLDFESSREQVRAMLRNQRVMETESVYVARIISESDIELSENALEVMRSMARQPGARLGGRASRRALASYRGGVFTQADLQVFLQNAAPALRNQIERASDEDLDGFLRDLVRSELLAQKSIEMGFEVPADRVDSIRVTARRFLVGAARQMGLFPIRAQEGESRADAAERQVSETLRTILAGDQNLTPIGAVSYSLRRVYEARVFTPSFPQVIERIRELEAPPSTPAPVEEPAPGDSAA